MCAQALTGCPARSGSRPLAASRRIASGQGVVIPLPLGPVILRPGGADSASSTAATAAAHSAVRSPCSHARAADRGGQLHLPVRRTPGPGPDRAGPRGPARTSPANKATTPRSQAPAPPAERRQQLLVRPRPGTPGAACPHHRQISRQADSGPAPAGQRRQLPADARPPAWPSAAYARPAAPAVMPPGPVDQPGHRALVTRPRPVPCPACERGQEPARAASGIASCCYQSCRQLAWVARGAWAGVRRPGQVAQPGGGSMSSALSGSSPGRTSLGHLLHGFGRRRCWRSVSSREGQASRI
jgi:hypothetical protein